MAFAVSAYSETPFSAEPSDVTVIPIGLSLSTQTGNFITQANADASVTGSSITSLLGQADAFSLVVVSVIGVSASIVSGNEDAFTDITVEVTSAGSLNVVNQIFEQDTLAAFGEAPFATESPSTFTPANVIITGTANIIPTSIALSVITGNEDTEADANVPVTGNNLITGAGQVFAGTVVDISVTGIPLNIDLGTPIITPNTIAQITGQSLNTFIGNETIQANADVSVIGIDLNSQIDSVFVTGTVNISLTGTPLTTVVGTVDNNSTYTVSGTQLTTAIGQATADDASAEIIGVSATTSVGSVKFIIWSQVDTGTEVTWTDVDLAA
jgi:hypothetical protein